MGFYGGMPQQAQEIRGFRTSMKSVSWGCRRRAARRRETWWNTFREVFHAAPAGSRWGFIPFCGGSGPPPSGRMAAIGRDAGKDAGRAEPAGPPLGKRRRRTIFYEVQHRPARGGWERDGRAPVRTPVLKG